MNNKAAIGAVLLVCLTGCENKTAKEQRTKIEQLETRLSALESNTIQLRSSVQRVDDGAAAFSNQWTDFVRTNSHHMDMLWDRTESNFVFTLSALQFEQDSMGRLTNLEAISNRIPRAYAAVRPQPQAPSMTSGVPTSVYNEIVAKAAKEYPDSYSMQVNVIKWEIEAYQKLHP